MNPAIRRTVLVAAALSITGAAAYSPASDGPDPGVPLPQEIQGMSRVRVTEGAEARALISKLHGEDLAPLATFVGHYGSGPTHAMLYTSRFDSAAAVDEALEAMSSAIGEQSSGFNHHVLMDVAGTPVHMVLGQGKVHFFFANDARLSWLAIEASMARGGLATVLGLDPAAVPSIVRAGGMEGAMDPARTAPEGPSSGSVPSPEE